MISVLLAGISFKVHYFGSLDIKLINSKFKCGNDDVIQPKTIQLNCDLNVVEILLTIISI